MTRFSAALPYGPGLSDSQVRIDPNALHNERWKRAQETMRKHSIGSILATGVGYGRYLSGLTDPHFADAPLWHVLMPVEGDCIVFMHAGYISRGPTDSPWIKEWRIGRSWLRGAAGIDATKHEATAFAQDVQRELKRLALDSDPVGVAGIDAYGLEALSECGLEIVPGDPVLVDAMAVKTPTELNCLRMAGAITDRAYSTIAREVRTGMLESEASALARAAAVSGGADGAFAGFRAGPLAAERGIRHTNQHLLPGQNMIVNLCSTSFLGYKSCVYRTFTLGREADAQEEEWMTRLQERLGAVIEELRPGSDTRAAAERFPPASTWGHAEEVEVLTIEIGHGIGLHQYEAPIVNRQWSLEYPQTLEPGMVIAVEGREGRPGEKIVRLEHMVIVTDTGPEVIDRFPASITPLA